MLITFADNFSASFTISKNNCKYIFHKLKQKKKIKLTLKGWNRPVCHLLGLIRVFFFQIWSISPSERDANLDGVFCSFAASFKSLGQEKRWQNYLRYWTGRPSLYLYLLLSRNWYFIPTQQWLLVRQKKKNSVTAICPRYERALSRFGARLRILNLIVRLC